MSELAVSLPGDETVDSRAIYSQDLVDPSFQIGVIPGDFTSVHGKDIVLDRWGLFDPRSLVPYMTRDHCADLHSPRTPYSCKLEFHHGLFPKDELKGLAVPYDLRRLRKSKYYQFQMWSCQEDLFHQDVAARVPIEDLDVEAAERFMEEVDDLDRYAATSWGLAGAKQKLESGSVPRMKMAFAQVAAEVYETANARALEKVKQIEVMPFGIVTGALQHHLDIRHEDSMAELVAQRIALDSLTFVTRTYDEAAVRERARKSFHREVGLSNLAIRRIAEAAVVA